MCRLAFGRLQVQGIEADAEALQLQADLFGIEAGGRQRIAAFHGTGVGDQHDVAAAELASSSISFTAAITPA